MIPTNWTNQASQLYLPPRWTSVLKYHMSLSLPTERHQQILNWHESANPINNGVPVMIATDILKTFKESETFFDLMASQQLSLVFKLSCASFPMPPSVYQTSSSGSLAGHLTRLAAECQRFLMSAPLGLFCFGFTVNYTVLQLMFGSRPVCYPESAWGYVYLFGPCQSEKRLLEALEEILFLPQKGNEIHTQGLGA